MSDSSEKFQGRYHVADGYTGKSRPQSFTIHAYELEEDMTDEEIESFYELSVEDAFQQNITPEPDRVEDFVKWARAAIDARKGEEK